MRGKELRTSEQRGIRTVSFADFLRPCQINGREDVVIQHPQGESHVPTLLGF
jgi:hypothetical protein